MNSATSIITWSRMLFLLVMVFSGRELFGQSFTASEVSSRFLSDNDYDSLIRTLAMPAARRNDVTERDYNMRYTTNRYRFVEILQPLLQNRFSVLDQRYERTELTPGAPGYATIRGSYLKQAREVIQSAMQGTNLFLILVNTDYSDRILNFYSEVTVRPDGKLEVSEFITVFNGNGQASFDSDSDSPSFGNDDIQRGIVRDFPTSYEDKNGFWSDVGFKLKGVFKNGEPEPYSLEPLTNGTRIKMGKKELILPQGIYKYRIDYETDRQLIFHSDKDELYWNVNGNGWVFTVDSISCLVRFPDGAVIKENACYTGSQGSTNRDCNFRMIDGNSIFFSSLKRLDSYEGLTIAASIQKGILVPPAMTDDVIAFLKSNFIIPALSSLLILLFAFYYIIWYRKGRDPQQGVIYPQFSPPAGLNPADVGYIMDQHFGSHLFAAALIDCAVKKYLEIEVKQEGLIVKSPAYYFNRPSGMAQVPDTISSYGFNIETLYGQTAKRGSYNSTLKSCYNSLEETLKKRFLIRKGKPNSLNGLFMLNRGYTRFGGFLLVCSILLSVGFMIGHPTRNLLIITVAMIVALIILHIIFVRIMSAYTRQGRDIADQISGFRMYLEQAEQRIFEKLTPPEKTLELFEKYLPYAIALKVENSWAEKFDDIVQKAMEAGYQPSYYMGVHHGLSMHSMSRQISSGLSGTVSSASTPPSKSSGGSGGGGSSGGGGGGGGGGGW